MLLDHFCLEIVIKAVSCALDLVLQYKKSNPRNNPFRDEYVINHPEERKSTTRIRGSTQKNEMQKTTTLSTNKQ